LGARRVYAIEPNDAIELARQNATANGFAGRIEFIQDLSTRISLPEVADVIVSDIRGVLPMFRDHIPTIIDARCRFLAPGGLLIPQEDRLYVAIVNAPEHSAERSFPSLADAYGLDLNAGQEMLRNGCQKAHISSDHFASEAVCWQKLDYSTIDSPNVSGSVSLKARTDGTAHGLIVWFEATLFPGIGFSARDSMYRSMFFPFLEPVELSSGDEISLFLGASLVGCDYVWRWETTIAACDAPENIKACFKQSTFFEKPVSLARLHRRSGTFVPSLGDEGRIERRILDLMDGSRTLNEISEQLITSFPGRFADVEALERVRSVTDAFADASGG
jgi:protein arginine N-methyltransferase 1